MVPPSFLPGFAASHPATAGAVKPAAQTIADNHPQSFTDPATKVIDWNSQGRALAINTIQAQLPPSFADQVLGAIGASNSAGGPNGGDSVGSFVPAAPGDPHKTPSGAPAVNVTKAQVRAFYVNYYTTTH
jgi:hypothetical protein